MLIFSKSKFMKLSTRGIISSEKMILVVNLVLEMILVNKISGRTVFQVQILHFKNSQILKIHDSELPSIRMLAFQHLIMILMYLENQDFKFDYNFRVFQASRFCKILCFELQIGEIILFRGHTFSYIFNKQFQQYKTMI